MAFQKTGKVEQVGESMTFEQVRRAKSNEPNENGDAFPEANPLEPKNVEHGNKPKKLV